MNRFFTQKSLVILISGLVLTCLMAVLQTINPVFSRFLDFKVQDTMMRSLPTGSISNQVVVVDLDENSLRKYGQWPWPRHRVARLLKELQNLGAVVVSLDILFAEKDRTSPLFLKKQMQQDLDFSLDLKGLPVDLRDYDKILAQALSHGPFVLSYCFSIKGQSNSHPPGPALNLVWRDSEEFSDHASAFFRADNAVSNLAVLQKNVTHSGYMDAFLDTDGVLRGIPMITEYHGKFYPSLALATLLKLMNTNQALISMGELGAEKLILGRLALSLSPKATLLLRFRGGPRSLPYVSAENILTGQVDPSEIKGKIVFVGTSAAGLRDQSSTPLAPGMDGVEIHATCIDNIIQGDFLVRPAWFKGMELVLLLAVGLAGACLLAWAPSLWAFLSAGLISAALWVFSFWLIHEKGLVSAPFMPFITLALVVSLGAGLKNWMEERQLKKRALELFHTQNAMIMSLAALAECHDVETGKHLLRTQAYVGFLADHLKDHPRFKKELTPGVISTMKKMAPLHDAGKVGIPDSILLKPGRLSQEEFKLVKMHTLLGEHVMQVAENELGPNPFLTMARQITGGHHEKYDGSGYPRGLIGDQIPLSARIMAVADVYDALTTNRPYKKAYSHEKAMEIMIAGRGSHFDPDVLDALIRDQEAFRDVARNMADSVEDHQRLMTKLNLK
ncbi:CHASE2 domain-containing protein [Dethiosulfatarculus sandiegensis]|uniref:Chemotaxis protein CheY n=1 Tax=Dethiosulfatarculus sandiegensis TaxID=1429043 RepID=A0A0D2IYT1_9BACT|nr:CHASE2 domain-containing protein [Dethiosulfatarculus sandiegensis]KIX11189.1 chemotaxis protein CheY [Dethiosulfatarculus sandiegensis]